jgi:hypothetical protein
MVRYLMNDLGPEEAATELVSYLLFDHEFCARLLELGRADVARDREHVERFFAGGR